MIYELIIRMMVLALRLAALRHPKAKLWAEGRKVFPKAPWARGNAEVLWVHVSSLGEFEQGRPFIEAFKAQRPAWKIVLTFFSPSGYEMRKNYPHADLVCYLPADTRANARKFLEEMQPSVAVFVKYDFWANYLSALSDRGTKTLLISAAFRPSQPFFKWYGSFWRKMLACFSHVFLQDAASGELLRGIGFERFTVAGDTRADRVLQIAESSVPNPVLERFAQAVKGAGTLIVGSSWPPDEALVFGALNRSGAWPAYLVIAPHDPSEANVARVCGMGAAMGALRYSEAAQMEHWPENARCLVIDNVGMLNTLYRYGDAAYIGGGFGKGIHNTLEPAAFGLPVIFGPKHQKFEEAKQMLVKGGAFCINDQETLEKALKHLSGANAREQASEAIRRYLFESRGATARVLGYLD
jgi:3-deoxy-D-manno-octulosonic-acid transferase